MIDTPPKHQYIAFRVRRKLFLVGFSVRNFFDVTRSLSAGGFSRGPARGHTGGRPAELIGFQQFVVQLFIQFVEQFQFKLIQFIEQFEFVEFLQLKLLQFKLLQFKLLQFVEQLEFVEFGRMPQATQDRGLRLRMLL